MRPFLVALVLSALSGLAARAGDLRNFSDAALHAIQFVDDNEGWAVGDEGVVWHTIDGGASWERQPTGVRASLWSLHFLTPYTGWVAGREELPHGTGSVGVLLFTSDGGLKWQRVATNALPGLNRVQFVDNQTGFLLGDGSDQYPTGIFRTQDAGRTWKPVAGPRSPAWLAGDFQDRSTGALAGAWGRLGLYRQEVLGSADVDTLGGRSVHGLQVMGRRAIAVGQGGLILLSRDSAGARWGYPDPAKWNPPAELRACWDFKAVHAVGDKIWVVGRPGTTVLHSPDRGETWTILQTGHALPLNGVHFRNEQRGWVVGEFGTILTTADGGKNWRVQRRGGQRSAVLFVHSRSTGLPVDTVAVVGGEEGYLAAGLRVNGSDPASSAPGRASEAQRFTAAMRQAGGAAGEMLWQFPVPQHLARASKDDLLASWNRIHAERAPEELLRQLVLSLRIWRPSVVVTDHPDLRVTGWPTDALLTEALHEAVARAADPKAFPEQLKEIGLQPWEVSKVYSVWNDAQGAQVTVDLDEVRPRLESSAREFAALASGFLADTGYSLPPQRYYHLLESKVQDASLHRFLLQGAESAPGGVARRQLPEIVTLPPELEKALRTRRNLQALAEGPASTLTDPNKLLTMVGPMLKGLPDDQAARAAFAVADRFARGGQWSLARELYLHMVQRYPAHPLAVDAYRWLIRYNVSSEARRRHELGQFMVVTNATVIQATGPGEGPVQQLSGGPEGITSKQLVQLGNAAETRQWYQGSLDLGQRLAAFGPLFATDPSVQLCMQAARRHLGEFEKAQEWYTHFVAEQPPGPWRDAAAAEIWLSRRSGMSPKPLVLCRHTEKPPFLDGKFDDACWQQNKPLELRNANGDTSKDYKTEVRLAYDKDFLYVALQCQHPADRYVAPVKVRPRDADLRPYDRVSILLDLDRDYSTYFQLQVDQRGCVCEDCWGDRTWNPRWFVACQSDKQGWQIEAAIPMNELTSDAVTIGKAWACNIVRVLPGRGVQAWSLPADVQPRPEGMGLLMFTQEATAGTKKGTSPATKGP